MMYTCANCGQSFEITKKDLAFYEKVSPVIGGTTLPIPPPTLCPDCRRQRRISFRMERKLYHRKCDLSGRQIISVYKPGTPYKVYEHKEWYSDKWDPMVYGRPFDFARPFFEQFRELMLEVPRPSLDVKTDNENCDYTNLITRSRNCYLCFASSDCEDCLYTSFLQRDRNVCDCFFIFDSELCYECIDCYHGYNLRYCQYTDNCSDSSYLFNCKGCKKCFGCVNLVNKEHHLFNELCPKEEYETKVTEILANPKATLYVREKLEELQKTLPQKYYAGIGNENVSGDHISFSKNTFDSYDCTYLEDCRYCTWFHESKDCYDCYGWGHHGELTYECHLAGNNFRGLRFCESCWNEVSDLLYCHFCVLGTRNSFGCIGLRGKEYCILNTQYSKEEYEEFVPKIIEHMRKDGPALNRSEATGSWGEFFPTELSPFAYNETVAQDYYPLSKEEVQGRGWSWYDEEERESYMGPKVEVPPDITFVSDAICEKILTCEITGRPYKIIPQELKFYRLMHIPIPRRSFEQRHRDRLALRNPRRLWSRNCAKCHKQIATSYAPDRPESVVCEECYLSTVY